jgi:uncharacterized protein DUF2795
MTRGLGGQSPANVQLYLKGVQYPASKDELLRAARSNQAPEEVLEVIEQFPGEQYGGPQDVMKAYGDSH